MDVRCEKCQTEYELDESRLKPGGVTVKCTNCGHMFKIRKRSNTNVGVPTAAEPTPPPVKQTPPKPVVTQPSIPAQQPPPRAASHSDAPMDITDVPSGPNSQRQWLVRLENGETKTCRELAVLQQWIVAGIVSRESLISRSGKTWKRLGDIAELGQYFVIADEAKAQRSVKPTGPTGTPAAAGTMLGVGMARSASNIDDEEGRSTGNFRARQPTPPPPPAALPKANPLAKTEPSGPYVRPPTQPPPTPPQKKIDVPPGRATAAWASNDIKASDSMAAMPQGPRGGKLSAGPDEPAFAGKVRVNPSDRSQNSFDGKIASDIDDDDDVYQPSRGSRAGMWIALVALLVIGAAAGAVYMFVFKAPKGESVAQTAQDAGVMGTADAQSVVVTPLPSTDAAVEVAAADAVRGELVAGVHTRMKTALETLEGKDDAAALALRARLMTNLAQGMQDRAGFADKAEADKLRKEAKQIVMDAAPLAQRAIAAAADSVDANLAMADVMRLQGKPAPSVKRYITTAKGKADKSQTPSVALSESLLAMRDGKLSDAQAALTGVDAPDDMRIKVALAQIAYAQNKQADAKAQVDQILATQPDHDAALAMYKKLETIVAKDDPLPPEDNPKPTPNTGSATKPPPPTGGGDYDSLLAQANKAAETNCTKAMELYNRALSQKPQGVEALTGTGYCHLDRKEFSSAFSKFRAALLVSPRFEPALGGIAETYQRQGNKQAAISAWNKYLEVFPGSPKAKKQLEILGAGDAPKPNPEPEKKPEEEKPEEPAPTPAPAPAPAPTTSPTPSAGSASN